MTIRVTKTSSRREMPSQVNVPILSRREEAYGCAASEKLRMQADVPFAVPKWIPSGIGQ
jgi:hypothetical protein